MENLEARSSSLASIHRIEDYRRRKNDISWFTGPETVVAKRKKQIVEIYSSAVKAMLIVQIGVENFIDQVLGPRLGSFPENIIEVDFKSRRRLA
jgi:hypothetical protein